MTLHPRLLRNYWNSRWLPAGIFLALLLVFGGTSLLPLQIQSFAMNAASVGVGISLLGILAAVVWNFSRRRWSTGWINLGLFVVCLLASAACLFFIALASMFGPSEDGFADKLTIPPGITVEEPEERPYSNAVFEYDPFQKALYAALATPGSDDQTVTADVSALLELQRKAPSLLRRYLESSPAWRVFEERGVVYATRRWMLQGMWRYELHGYYSQSDTESGTAYFQHRFTIGLGGKPWARNRSGATQFAPGEAKLVNLSTGNGMYESHCIVEREGLAVELFEQSEAKERRLTKAALAYLNSELRPLAENPTVETVQRLVTPEGTKQGQASLGLVSSFQPGIYDSVVWVNPGEAGRVYLKAFEVTRGTQLSDDRLKESSNEWIGWSSDPDQLFLSNTHFMIYEGDWGKPYAARFELWFIPDSGKPERKLLEKVFRIEGWQR